MMKSAGLFALRAHRCWLPTLQQQRQQVVTAMRNAAATTTATAAIGKEHDQGTAEKRHFLVDTFGRFHKYIRMAVMEDCNMRCKLSHHLSHAPCPPLLTTPPKPKPRVHMYRQTGSLWFQGDNFGP